MSQTPTQASATTLLKGVSDYFFRQTLSSGELRCPKHGLEHTGKNVYSALIDSKLFVMTGNEEYFRRALQRVERTLMRFGKDPETGAWIFLPGRLAPRNMSTSAIDGGACADALAEFYTNFKDRLEKSTAQKILDALALHADSYLKQACMEKPVTNQRLWAGTGLASAYALLGGDSWKRALQHSLEKSFSEQRPDGTFNYHPHYAADGEFEGENDCSPYYQGRTLAFAWHILAKTGLTGFESRLLQGTELLAAMYQPNGIKCMNLETKRWYWESPYEVASNAFDVYAFMQAHAHAHDPRYAAYASQAFQQLLAHQLPDGGITSSHGSQNNFKCRVFWNAHLAWTARALDRISFPVLPSPEDGLRIFPDSGIVKYASKNYCALFRSHKAAMNIGWGSPFGGGSLLYFGTRDDAWADQLQARAWAAEAPGNFLLETRAREKILPSIRQFLSVNQRAIPHALWIAWNELLAGNAGFALAYPFREILAKALDEMKPLYASQWADTGVEVEGTIVHFTTRPSTRLLEPLPHTILRRSYSFETDCIHIKERLHSADDLVRVTYQKLPFVKTYAVETDAPHSDTSQTLVFCPHGLFNVSIEYTVTP